MLTMSVRVIHASTGNIGPATRSRSLTIGITTAADDAASRTTNMPTWSISLRSAISHPPGTATANEIAVAIAPMSIASRRPRSRSGSRVPTMNISIAKPIAERKASVGSSGCTSRRPVCPTATPAAISPTTTGTVSRVALASSGPTRPQATISVRIPNVTGTLNQMTEIATPPKIDVVKQAKIDLAAACFRAAALHGFNEGIDNHFSLAVPGRDDLLPAEPLRPALVGAVRVGHPHGRPRRQRRRRRGRVGDDGVHDPPRRAPRPRATRAACCTRTCRTRRRCR